MKLIQTMILDEDGKAHKNSHIKRSLTELTDRSGQQN